MTIFARFVSVFTTTNKKKKSGGGGNLIVWVFVLFLQLHSFQTTKRGLIRGDGVCLCVCVPSVCCEYEFVGWSGWRPFVDFVCSRRGMDCMCVFVCLFCLKRALSFGSLTLCLCLSLSYPSNSCFDLHLNLITFTRKYYLYYVCFLLPLICNNSCILRDATVCVFFLFLFCFCGGVWFCLLAIAQFVGCCLGVAELLLISWSFYCFLLCVGVIRGML